MLKFVVLLSFLILSGCAAALVPASNNPRTKINQAMNLYYQQGRPFGAVRLLEQAIPLAQEQGDKESEAIASFFLGEIYQTPGPNGKKLENPERAIELYDKSIMIFDGLKYFKSSAFAHWKKSSVYKHKGRKKEECEALRKAEASYEKSDEHSRDILSPAYGNLLEAIRQVLNENKC